MASQRSNHIEYYRHEPDEAFTESRSVTNLYEPNTLIRREGDPSEFVFFVESGFLAISKTTSSGKRQIMNFVFPGEYCCITLRESYSYDIESLSFSSVRSIERNDFNSAITHNPNALRLIYEQMVLFMDGSAELIFLMGTQKSVTKIASFLLYLHIRQMRYLSDPMYKEIPLSRSDIGDFLGMRVETVSRTISKLREMKVIESYDNNRIRILDFPKICELAEMNHHCSYQDKETRGQHCSTCMLRKLNVIDSNRISKLP